MMTRADHYREGKANGERWAEADIRDGMRDFPNYRPASSNPMERANQLGFCRGYRQVARTFKFGKWGT